MSDKVELVCKKRCGFRVNKRYFEQKTRFSPGVCPRGGCAADVEVLVDGVVDPTKIINDKGEVV